MHAMLYSESSWLSEPFVRLPELAERAKVPDVELFARCLADDGLDAVFEADEEAIKALGATGVPTVMVDSLLFVGSVPDSLRLLELVHELRGS